MFYSGGLRAAFFLKNFRLFLSAIVRYYYPTGLLFRQVHHHEFQSRKSSHNGPD